MGLLDLLHKYDKGIDPEVDKWLLMSSPVPVLSILTFYLIFVLKLGPALMRNVQPFKLKTALLVYNLIQISYCTYIFFMTNKVARITETLVHPECKVERNQEEQMEFYTVSWHCLLTKILDLFDTIFFVLRKKQNQITFLHVYHHAIMVFLVWFFIKYLQEEQCSIIGLLNSFVHMLMYTYYLISSLGPQYQKYLWWKKYMTKIQLIQFILVLLYMVAIALKGCPVSRRTTYFGISQALLFFYLFYRFYRRTYNKAQQNKSKDK